MQAEPKKTLRRTKPDVASKPNGRPRQRIALFAFGLVLVATTTFVALRQPPRASVDRAPTLVESFSHPVEKNAFRRLPLIEGDLRSVHALADARTAWIVGPDELILYTRDGGRRWVRQSVPADGAEPIEKKTASFALVPHVRASEAEEGPVGVVLGVCVDKTGAVIPGVQIELRDLNTKETTRAQSDANGYFAVRVPIGAYMFTARVKGFRAVNVEVQLVKEEPEWNMGKLLLDLESPTREPTTTAQIPNLSVVPEPTTANVVPVPEAPEGPATLHAVQFLDPNVGWIVGDNGTLLTTSNGGERWLRRDAGQTNNLVAVHVVDPKRGYVVTDQGRILFSDNGGRTWRQQYAGGDPLRDIEFVDDQTGWALSARAPAFVATIDGGANWERRTLPGSETIASLDFIDRQRGWAVGADGAIFRTADGGTRWTPQESSTDEDLLDVRFRDPNRGVAVGRNGTVVVTDNGGGVWRRGATSSAKTLRSVHLTSDGGGWAVGRDVLLRTTDGGDTWHRQARANGESTHWLLSGSSAGLAVRSGGEILETRDQGRSWVSRGESLDRVRAIAISEAGALWALSGYRVDDMFKQSTDFGRTWSAEASSDAARTARFRALAIVDDDTGLALLNNELYQTRDGGKTWNLNSTLASTEPLVAIQFTDDGTGFVVSENGTIYSSLDRGASWSRRASASADNVHTAHFADRDHGCVLEDGDADRSILHCTRDGGTSWSRSERNLRLRSVHVETSGRRWAVGADGVILVQRRESDAWAPSASGVDAELTSIQFDGVRSGFVSGVDDTFLVTRDGGASWSDAAPYRRAPAPWFYLSLLAAALLFLVPALRKPEPESASQSSIADVFVTDKPVELASADRLQFNELAHGLSRFLRNENTTPPMTIAIAGAWGTGKSSLMNLLRSLLTRYKFRPVWFNAWHHQKGNQLLAALLETIRSQAVPAWWRPDGFSFRLRLLFLRGWRHSLPVILMLLVFSVSAGYIAAQGPVEVQNNVRGIIDRLVALFSPSEAPVEVAHSHFLPFLISSLTLLASAWRGLTAFSAGPGKLMASVTAGLRMKDVDAAHSVRHQFAQEFRDVTEAFAPRRMVIFIDDLDRCAPENVLETLEAVNFLVSTGDCFVVVGMAMEQVEHCVAVALDERGQTPEAGNGQSDGGYARFYMEKLINIEVPVPTMTSALSSQLLAPDERDREVVITPPWSRWLTPAMRRAIPALSLLAVVVFGYWFGKAHERAVDSVSTPLARQASDSGAVETGLERTQPPPRGDVAVVPVVAGGTARLLEGASPQTIPMRYFALGAIAFLAFGVWKLGQPPEIIVKDSPDFARALRFWSPLVYASRQTPRGVKRYLNRVRYYEMLQRPAGRFVSWWARLVHRVRDASGTRDDGAIPEEILVALAAVELVRPEGLRDSRLWTDFNGYLRHELKMEAPLPKAIDDHLDDVIEEWPSLVGYRDTFMKLIAGVHMS